MELLVSLPRLHPSKLEGELDYCYTNLHVIPEVFKVHTHIHTNKVPINYWPKKVSYAMHDLYFSYFSLCFHMSFLVSMTTQFLASSSQGNFSHILLFDICESNCTSSIITTTKLSIQS